MRHKKRIVMELNCTNELNLTNNCSVPSEDNVNSTMKAALDGILLVVLIIIMLSMGCDITLRQVFLHLKRPIGVLCGMLSQFLLLPLCAYGFTQAFQLNAGYATGVLIISCSPGGVLSNTFTYFCDGDLALSVTMTTVSTLMALGFLPLNMWLYNTQIDSGTLVIPYGQIALSLVYVTSPTAVGMLMRWKIRKIACYITKFGSYSGAGLIFLCIVLQIIMFPSMFDLVPWKLYLAVLLLPAIGLSIGYGLAALFRLTVPERKTVAMECGIQNVPIALTIVSLSFEHKDQMDIAVFPALYGFSMMTSASCACFIYNGYKRWWSKQDGKRDAAENGEVVESLMPMNSHSLDKQEPFKGQERPYILISTETNGWKTTTEHISVC